MQHAELTTATPVEQVVDLLRQPPGPWPEHWAGFENVNQAFRRLFDEAAGSLPPSPAWPAERGIVICAGGWRFFASLFVTVKMIRRLGCFLPIQVWYLGDQGEFDPRMAAALADEGVGWINGQAFARDNNCHRRILGGWELKAFAAAYAPFREVISLDADCYPATNPEHFMAHGEYQRVGAAFWPDNQPLEPGQWERFGIPPHDEPSWESGQFMVDKGRHWRPLRLAVWLNDYSDFVYHHIYGDKDTFHLAWRKCGHEVCVPAQRPAWHAVAFLQPGFDGRPLFVHRCRDKFRWSGEIDGAGLNHWYMTPQWHSANQFVAGLPHERAAHDFCRQSSELVRPEAHFRLTAASDQAAWKECNLFNVYRLPANLAGQTVLDIGANCGGFAWAALARGAARVLSCEPHPGAADCCRANLAQFGERASVRQAAAFDGRPQVTLCDHAAKPGDSTLLAVAGLSADNAAAGIEVSAVGLDELLAELGPVDLVKLDCEGSEYAILEKSTRLGQVGRLVCEWHAVTWHGGPADHQVLAEILYAAGWRIDEVTGQGQNVGLLFAHNPAWVAPPRPSEPPPAAADDPLACRHRGGQVRSVPCELCGQHGRQEAVYACRRHGECTRSRYQSGSSLACCLGCPDQTP